LFTSDYSLHEVHTHFIMVDALELHRKTTANSPTTQPFSL